MSYRSILAACAFVASAVFAAASQPGSYFASSVSGQVKLVAADGTETNLATNTELPQGAVIRTGRNSSAILVFANGATTTLGANTEVEITKFYQEAFSGTINPDSENEPSVSQTEIDLRRGDITGRVRRLSSNSSFVVNTPVGAAGVRGTIFNISYNPATGTYTLSTVTGLMNFQSGNINENVSGGIQLSVTFQIDAAGQIIPATIEIVRNNLTPAQTNVILNSLQGAVVPSPDLPGPGEPTFTVDPELIVTPSPSAL